MRLDDLFDELPDTKPLWDGSYKIPWDDPDFSRRMLREHLSQDHDLASRKFDAIERQVDWIDRDLLNGKPSRILDLACGPGLYAHRLAARGYTVTGIDFSPASIEYARENNSQPETCEFVLGDLRSADFGTDNDLAIFIYGEFNAFAPSEIANILTRSHRALSPGGTILIEAHTPEQVERTGKAPNSWYHAPSGLFADRPHMCLMTNRWHEEQAVAETEFFVIDMESGACQKYRNTLKAYTLEEYKDLLQSTGFTNVQILPHWGKEQIEPGDQLLLIIARQG